MAQRKQWLPRLLAVVVVVCTYLFATMGASTPAYAGSIPGGDISDPVVRSVDIAKPAVVRIWTKVSGHLAVTFSGNTNVTFPQGGGKEYQQDLFGTGTLITSHGDILTADHVVNPPAEVLQEAAAQDVAAYINQHPGSVPGVTSITADQVLQGLATNQLPSVATYSLKQSEAFLSNEYTGPQTVADISNVPTPLRGLIQIEKESAVDQKDVAIVHASFPINDLPAVQLGDSSTVHQLDQLVIIGFPGNGDVSMSATNLLTSSVNKITVSSIKTTDNNAPVIQVGGNVEHGDSGGPALDNKGAVVGVVSFGLQTAQDSGSTSFLQASSSAQSLLQTLKLDTTPGPFQTQWVRAFNDYASTEPGHWHKAAQELQQLANGYPQFKGVVQYLNYAQTQASSEKTNSPATQPPPAQTQSPASNSLTAIMLTVGALAGIVLLVGLLFGVLIRQRKRGAKSINAVAPAPPAALKQGAAPPTAPSSSPANRNTPAPGQANRDDDGMAAFGAPPGKGMQTPVPSATSLPTTPQNTISLRAWPCGHMNRSNARFCAICGEAAPEPPTIIRRVEQ